MNPSRWLATVGRKLQSLAISRAARRRAARGLALRRRRLGIEGLEERTVPAAPVSVADSYTVLVNATLTVDATSGVLANDTDADNDTLTAIEVDPPSNGDLTLSTDGSFTYTPHTDFFGTDTFTYKARDAALDSDPVTVTIDVNKPTTTALTAAPDPSVFGQTKTLTATVSPVARGPARRRARSRSSTAARCLARPRSPRTPRR